jgi:hypothetical protein
MDPAKQQIVGEPVAVNSSATNTANRGRCR